MKKFGRTIPAWKRKYDELFEAAGNKIPDGKSTNSYNKEFSETYGVPFGTVNSHYYSKGISHPIPKEAKGIPEWKDQIQKDISAGNIPMVAKPYIQRIALAFEANFSTVHAFYYKTIKEESAKEEAKQREEQQKQQAETLKEESKVPAEPPQEEPKKTPLHPGYTYRKGSIVKVRVKAIDPGYVLVETMDDYKIAGMIHISQVSNTFISDINKWFKFGLELSAQVIDYTELDGGRLNLSTRNLAFTALSWKYKKNGNEATPYQEKLAQAATQLFNNKEEKPGGEPDMEQEWKQAKPFIENMIGTVTPAAETEMRKLMKETGVFAFTMSLMEKKGNFTPDIGLMLAQSIRKDLSADKEGPR